MGRKMIAKVKQILLSCLCAVIVMSNALNAAPGTLSDVPLFLGTSVQPNVFIGLDDSGSMAFTVSLNDGTTNPGGEPINPGAPGDPGSWWRAPLLYTDYSNFYAGLVPAFTNDALILIPPFDSVKKRRLTCLGYNRQAYDPSFLYTPWIGEDDANILYGNVTLTTARENPYDASSTIDISSYIYFPWNDLDADGAYDGPASTDVNAGSNPATDECGDLSSTTSPDAVAVSSLPAVAADPTVDPNSQQNYANWFTYYRQREFIAKRAMSELITNSSYRMGLGTLHNNASVGTRIEDMSDSSKKDDLLEELFESFGNGGTPLRELMDNIGEYFDIAGSNSDHSPLGFTDSSPILSSANGGECQQNFALLFSDGFYNGSFSGLGDTDGNSSGTVINSDWDNGSHDDGPTNFADTLADIAMHYYEKDLATGIANNVNEPVLQPTDTPNDQQHLTTYTVAFGIQGTTANLPGTGTNINYDRTAAFTWPQPATNTPTTVDDMVHAAWNGRGRFLGASNPGELIDALDDVFANIADRTATAAAVTFNSNELDTGTQVYLTQFNSENWSGDVLAFNVNATTGAVITPEAWSVSTLLDAGTYDPNRVVYTHNGTQGSRLIWGSLTTAQQNDFRTMPDGSLETTSGFPEAQARLDYFKGDRTHESTGTAYSFRLRSSRLGDIVHSAPNFVSAPNEPYPDVDPFGADMKRYSDFKAANASRKGVLYVGANDGMLHAFDASANGDEIMAYVPAALFSSGTAGDGLHYLSDPNYSHKYYVDLSVTISDAYINTSTGGLGSPNWTTVLVGGLRGGGKGVFALDVTNPNSFSNSDTAAQNTVLWEFTDTTPSDTTTNDMGFSVSEPKIALMNNGKWAAIFGNGYNSTNGEAVLIIAYLEEGIDGTWTVGSDFEVLKTGSGTSGSPNGLGQVTVVDLNNDLVADRIYGGDLIGNLWAFDVSSTSTSSWKTAYGTGPNYDPVFTATDRTTPTPITSQPVTVKGAITRTETTTTANQPNVLVILGTGQYLTSADPSNTEDQSMYGVWDAGTSNLDKSNLVEQTITLSTDSDTGANVRILSDNNVNYASPPTASGGKYGWYIDLPTSGERVVVDPVIRAEQVFFATLIPNSQVCDNTGGTGWIMILDAENGGEPSGGGIDFNNDGNFDTNGSGDYVAGVQFTAGIPAGLGFLGGTSKLYVTDTSGAGAGSITTSEIAALATANIGRLSWQELIE